MRFVLCPVCHSKAQVWQWPVDQPDARSLAPCPVCARSETPDVCAHDNTFFSRSPCPLPCGAMHYYCYDCGEVLDECLNP